MGNSICQHIPDEEINKNPPSNQQPKIAPQPQVKIKCEICGQERSVRKMGYHLDICHLTFMNLRSNNSNQMQITCLLCDEKMQNLEKYKSHLRIRHPFADAITRKYIAIDQNKELETNRSIKQRVKSVKNQQVSLGQDGNYIIRGEKFKVSTFQRQYTALEFNQLKATTDLVWKQIFDQVRDAVYFNIDFQPLQKSIKGVAKIFSRVNSAPTQAVSNTLKQ